MIKIVFTVKLLHKRSSVPIIDLFYYKNMLDIRIREKYIHKCHVFYHLYALGIGFPSAEQYKLAFRPTNLTFELGVMLNSGATKIIL